jgi:hypothetical protein
LLLFFFFFFFFLNKGILRISTASENPNGWVRLKLFKKDFGHLRYRDFGSSGKGLGFGGTSIKFEVRIPLSANNFLGPARW